MQVQVPSLPRSSSPARSHLKVDRHGSSPHSNAHHCALCASCHPVSPPMTRAEVRLAPQTSQKIRETMFGLLQSVDFDALKPIQAGFFETAIAATQKRASEEKTARLTQRLADLDRIKGFFSSDNGCEFLGFAGWGPGCAVQLPANAGMSQYHMVLYRSKDGQVFAEEIGSSYTIFESASRPAQHAGACCGHTHTHTHTHDHRDCEAHSPVETLGPITKNGIGYDFTLPKTPEDACGWARSIDAFVHETIMPDGKFKPKWNSVFSDQPDALKRFSGTHQFFHYFGESELGSVNSNLPDNTFLKPETVDIYLMLLEWKLQRLYKNRRLSETLNPAFQRIKTEVRTELGLQ